MHLSYKNLPWVLCKVEQNIWNKEYCGRVGISGWFTQCFIKRIGILWFHLQDSLIEDSGSLMLCRCICTGHPPTHTHEPKMSPSLLDICMWSLLFICPFIFPVFIECPYVPSILPGTGSQQWPRWTLTRPHPVSLGAPAALQLPVSAILGPRVFSGTSVSGKQEVPGN